MTTARELIDRQFDSKEEFNEALTIKNLQQKYGPIGPQNGKAAEQGFNEAQRVLSTLRNKVPKNSDGYRQQDYFWRAFLDVIKDQKRG